MEEDTEIKLFKNYEELPERLQVPPATEEQLMAFEDRFRPIPEDLRWTLANVGGGRVSKAPLYTIEELMRVHLLLKEEPKKFPQKFPAFIFGIDGNGNYFGQEIKSKRILIWDNDSSTIYLLAPNFDSLIMDGPDYSSNPLLEFRSSYD